MNLLERQMADHLRRMREEYHLIGIKTEFEGEGARMEELFRLKEITMAIWQLPELLSIYIQEMETGLAEIS